MDNFYSLAGRRIRNERERRGFSREYLATACGISSKHLYDIECNGKGFSAVVLYKIAKNLEVSCEYIAEGSHVNVSQERLHELKIIIEELFELVQ